jgi:TonB-dependent SusC/RagA subfamily outer membrane receptor
MFYKAASQQSEYTYSKEKIYMHTNHVFFKPGEQVFFKLYLVNGQDQIATAISNVVYVDVINPAGNVIQKLNYKVEDGYAEGSYDFTEQAPGGVYKLKAYTTWMQNETDSTFFVKELTVQKVIAPRVLLKLEYPKKGYGAGDEVLADFSMRSLSDQPIRNYKGMYTVSIGGKQVETASFSTDHLGKAKVKFYLPKELSTNDGLLNITVNYDGYTEAISRSIPIVLGKIDLQFMPEGGSLIEGQQGNVAFLAVNEFGKPVDVEGDIVNKNGKKVASFKAYKFGMGKFAFTPATHESYKAKITSPNNIREEFILPAIKADGISLNIKKEKTDLLLVLSSTSEMEVKLVGQTKGVNYYAEFLKVSRGENKIWIKEEMFPAGIARFTVYNADDQPLAERIMFLNEHKKLDVTITTDKKKYQPREKVTLTISTKDENGKPVPSNFSLSVIDDKLWSFADDKQDHILSWLLMSSELRGKIEEPQFYFKKDEPKAAEALDLVMLTHGYRYFDYIPYVKTEGQLRFTPDVQNILSGMIVNAKQEPVKASVFLVNTYNGGKAARVKTGDDGVFFFSGLTPNANYTVLSQSFKKKEKIYIKILQNGSGYNPLKVDEIKQLKVNDKFFATVKPVTIPKKNENENVNLKITVAERKKENANFEGNLESVVVTALGVQRRKEYSGATVKIDAKELANVPIVQFEQILQGRVPGLAITQNGNPGAATAVSVRGMMSFNGSSKPLYIVNGVPVEEYHIALVNPNDIESIEILKDAAATALYGSRAANGLIIVNMKKAGKEKISLNLSPKYLVAYEQIVAKNTVYSAARKFYVPKYNSLQTDERNDFRETIYWNPIIQTDKSGTASVEFYNSDATTTFRAIAEGIGYNGKLGRAEATYAAQNALSVDAKIPPYLTVGDKALVPLVIKNNSDVSQTLSISTAVPGNFTIGRFNEHVVLQPDSSCQILVPIEATAATKGIIRFHVYTINTKETLSLPIVAADKGFPVIETFSGDRSATHDFSINKMIPGTLTLKLKVFRDIEGQLLDGIESMLREPYGCFEQTSSTTYPNVYVLKYLRESGKSNPEIERKALGYIEKGYQRLIGFETANNGFEWFGKTPPHEALTAYGLLEFTDMQEIIKVDKAMLKRTKDFLLSRRDGEGGFVLASGGYDRFGSVPNKIANIYIVYALTQAGIGNEISKEYGTAVKKAIESNDAYQMAMMALAASNMKDNANYTKLMQLLSDSYRKQNLLCETSVVNSRDASLKVEAMSLYALALMRQPSPEIGLIAELVSSILKQKSYYGYGSTQATVLALKAVVEYAKITNSTSKNANIEFVLNSKAIHDNNVINSILTDGSNLFKVNFTKANETVPYNLEVAYSTLTPPNSDKAVLHISTSLSDQQPKVGETVRMKIHVKNKDAALQPMAIAKIGIPAGLSVQPWQLKEIMEQNKIAYYEIFDNYLVFYWMGFASSEAKVIDLDLKAEIPGKYTAKASNCYLYYTPEHKHWDNGLTVEVK